MGGGMARMEVEQRIEWLPHWLSWVGSTTRCLNALGVKCSASDVAGHSGYAFALSINTGVCPSGPTSLDWAALAGGVMALGRSALAYVSGDCFTSEHRFDRTRAHARTCFELACREIEAGRPCVVWGLGVPEFGVVRGIEDEEYLCVAGGATPERQRWDEIEAPGGPYLLAFPTAAESAWDHRREALRRAVQMMTRPDHAPTWTCGLRAYDYWIEVLQDRQALRFGHSYNAQCWAEARACARDFLGTLEDCNEAREAFAEAAGALARVAERFPFTKEPGNIEDAEAIESTVADLRIARDADARGLEAMRATL
jgi:hypothetical protein